MFYRKKYKEKYEEKERLERLCLLANTVTPSNTYMYMRRLYLTKCCRYPHNKACEIARAEWGKLEERVIKEGFYDRKNKG